MAKKIISITVVLRCDVSDPKKDKKKLDRLLRSIQFLQKEFSAEIIVQDNTGVLRINPPQPIVNIVVK